MHGYRFYFSIGLVSIAVMSTAMGCSRDRLYCDESTPCTQSDLSFCDLEGQHPASGGVGRTCIADPLVPLADAGPMSDGMTDAFVPLRPDATVDCMSSANCDDSTPICSSNSCELCMTGLAGNAACSERDVSRPLCGAAGDCRECNRNLDCGVGNPVCDASGACQPCTEHAECDSGACQSNGQCLPAGDIIYASTTGTDRAGCGTSPANACKTIGSRLDFGALDKVTNSRFTVVLEQGNYVESSQIDPSGFLVVIGNDSTVSAADSLSGSIFLIQEGASLIVHDLTVTSANMGRGVYCLRSDVEFHNSRLLANANSGATLSECTGQFFGCVIGNNGADGIVATDSVIEVRDSIINDNAFRGIYSIVSDATVLRTQILSNRAGGIRLANSSFLIENTVVAKNGDKQFAPQFPAGGITVVSDIVGIVRQTIRHTTIVGNHIPVGPALPVSAGVACDTVEPVDCPSNIVADNETLIPSPQASGACNFSYSQIPDIGGIGNITSSPSFVSTISNNFHLAPGAAAIDKAAAASPTLLDIDNQSRPNGTQADMGADEVY